MEHNTRLIERLWAKAAAFVLLVIFLMGLVVSALAVIIGWEHGFYIKHTDEIIQDSLDGYALIDSERFLTSYLFEGQDAVLSNGCNFTCDIYDEDQQLLSQNHNTVADCYEYEFEFIAYYDSSGDLFIDSAQMFKSADDVLGYDVSTYTVKAYVLKDSVPGDNYYVSSLAIRFISYMRYRGIAIAAVCALLSVILFIFLMCASGHRAGYEGIYAGPVT